MTVYPNCKINLGLQVIRRRSDGYHDLQTLFLPVKSLCDRLDITPLPSASDVQVSQLGIALDNDPQDNLCARAWRLLHDEFGIPPVQIVLHKQIPYGAGLGGGSSDAAATLKVLAQLFQLPLSDALLAERAARLGADCPFFVYNRPAYATGIGDRLEFLPEEACRLLDRYRVEIAIPEGEHVSTREAYANIHPSGEGRTDLRQAILHPVESWKDLITNDFEASVFPAHPLIPALKEHFYSRGALYASMSGSGAAVYGLFEA